ncbi:MAG: hypothetical protein GIX03_05405, partial [Candidatus Eremiobacteraeota bacterium]|nr:hypothetical protein [Candidatus Eremiobacteraeota bacterium]
MLHLIAALVGAVLTRAPAPLATARAVVSTTSASRDSGVVLPPVPALPSITPQTEPLPSGGIAGVTGPFVGISREAAIGMALLRNTDLAVAQSNRRIARYRVVAAEGVYDLQFQLRPDYQFSKQPAISIFNTGPGGVPAQTINTGATGGVSA